MGCTQQRVGNWETKMVNMVIDLRYELRNEEVRRWFSQVDKVNKYDIISVVSAVSFISQFRLVLVVPWTCPSFNIVMMA
jgi:hypothetical protein